MLDGIALLPLLAVVAFASYFQTVTGFGLGMIIMAATSAFALAPVPLVAAVVSLVMLVNTGIALPGRLREIDRRAVLMVLLAVPPAVILGVICLNYLSAKETATLAVLLGIAIIYSGVVFLLSPVQRAQRSRDRSFFVAGFFSGLFAGMFGMAGPPVMYHFYREPLAQQFIRNMLLLTFSFTALTRTLFVGVKGGLTPSVWLLFGLMLPLVIIATVLGRRCVPPVDQRVMRRVAALALVAIGASLIVATVLG